MQVAVTLIIYSPFPSEIEIASFRQCLKILYAYPIHIVCPVSLDTRFYERLVQEYEASVFFERFEDAYFSSVAGYNRLMKSANFYSRFKKFKYILIYQLDAWVFKDELTYWCEKGYDYIGAPWFTKDGDLLPIAGNGGFSLRKTSCFLQLLQNTICPSKWNDKVLFYNLPDFRPWYSHMQQMLQYLSNPSFDLTRWTGNEDWLFARILSFIGTTKVAPPAEAAFFSFECFPEKLYQITHNKLPFGCHAYAKYNPDFWRQWIKLP